MINANFSTQIWASCVPLHRHGEQHCIPHAIWLPCQFTCILMSQQGSCRVLKKPASFRQTRFGLHSSFSALRSTKYPCKSKMARRMQLLALLACCLIVAGLAPVTESTAIWNEMVSTDKGVWYQAAFYEYPIPNLQGKVPIVELIKWQSLTRHRIGEASPPVKPTRTMLFVCHSSIYAPKTLASSVLETISRFWMKKRTARSSDQA